MQAISYWAIRYPMRAYRNRPIACSINHRCANRKFDVINLAAEYPYAMPTLVYLRVCVGSRGRLFALTVLSPTATFHSHSHTSFLGAPRASTLLSLSRLIFTVIRYFVLLNLQIGIHKFGSKQNGSNINSS